MGSLEKMKRPSASGDRPVPDRGDRRRRVADDLHPRAVDGGLVRRAQHAAADREHQVRAAEGAELRVAARERRHHRILGVGLVEHDRDRDRQADRRTRIDFHRRPELGGLPDGGRAGDLTGQRLIGERGRERLEGERSMPDGTAVGYTSAIERPEVHQHGERLVEQACSSRAGSKSGVTRDRTPRRHEVGAVEPRRRQVHRHLPCAIVVCNSLLRQRVFSRRS